MQRQNFEFLRIFAAAKTAEAARRALEAAERAEETARKILGLYPLPIWEGRQPHRKEKTIGTLFARLIRLITDEESCATFWPMIYNTAYVSVRRDRDINCR